MMLDQWVHLLCFLYLFDQLILVKVDVIVWDMMMRDNDWMEGWTDPIVVNNKLEFRVSNWQHYSSLMIVRDIIILA